MTTNKRYSIFNNNKIGCIKSEQNRIGTEAQIIFILLKENIFFRSLFIVKIDYSLPVVKFFSSQPAPHSNLANTDLPFFTCICKKRWLSGKTLHSQMYLIWEDTCSYSKWILHINIDINNFVGTSVHFSFTNWNILFILAW